jgi:hypothetical protein
MVLYFLMVNYNGADPSGHAVGLRSPAYWDCGFEPRREYGCLSLVSVLYCQVEVLTTGRSVVQRSPTDCVCITG